MRRKPLTANDTPRTDYSTHPTPPPTSRHSMSATLQQPPTAFIVFGLIYKALGVIPIQRSNNTLQGRILRMILYPSPASLDPKSRLCCQWWSPKE